MKSNLTLILAALFMTALPALVRAQFTFTTNGGAITITGYNTAAGLNAVIPSTTNGYPVTSIGDEAFNGDTGLKSVTIPASVTSIGVEAFYYCPSLKTVAVPASVTSIGVEAFANSAGLTNINVDGANPDYSSLAGVLLDKAQATLIEFPGGLGGSYSIPASVNTIGDYAFYDDAGLTNVAIPASVNTIGSSAFGGCSGLTIVTISASVTSIGVDAFIYCTSLKSVLISASVTSIGQSAFYGCNSLTNFSVDGANPDYSSLAGVLFDKAQATLVEFPGGLGGSYSIPARVTGIGDYAFFGTAISSVVIPARVTGIGDYAFYDCPSLKGAYFQGNAPTPDDGTVFFDDTATVYYLTNTTGWGSTFGSVPAVLWNPQVTTSGFNGGQFGFNLTGPPNAMIVVEACANLSNPVWLPVATNTFSGAGTSAFSDSRSGAYPMRLYRIRSP